MAGVGSQPGCALVDAAQVFLDSRCLAWKVLVESAFRDRRFGREPLDAGGVDAVAVEQFGGRVQDALARASAALGWRNLVHVKSIPNGLHKRPTRVAWLSIGTPIGLLGVDMTQRSPVVMITGVSSGIGRAVADVFAAKGFEVFGTSRNPRNTEPVP